MGFHVIHQIGLQGPSEEIQFPDGGYKGLIALNGELNTFSATIRIKILLVISVKLTLIRLIDHETLAIQIIGSEVLTTEFCDKPVNNTQRNLSLASEIRHNLGDIWIGGIESLEGVDDEFGLTVDFLATGLRIGTVGFHLEG